MGLGWPSGCGGSFGFRDSRPVANCCGQPVEEDREDHHADATFEALGDVESGDTAVDDAAKATGADDSGDDDHRKGQHDDPVSYTHLRAHETDSYLVCR